MVADEGIRRERKVVTVLFADLAGFTARAETMDPEDVAAFLDPYHAALKAELERFGGTVEKFIGDAVMAVFGAPVAHEDDAERAVRAAISIRDRALEEGTELRIGLNTGEALVTLGSQPSEGQAMAAGDVVNTAARLQAAAPTGSVLVGLQTFRATERIVDYEAIVPVSAKGKAEPVPAWVARGLRSRAHVERAHGAELVGRRQELELLVGSLERARRERSPELVTLVGVPGIGKSRLVLELYDVIDAEPELTAWRHGRCLPYGDGVTFWALGEMVKAQAGILEGDGEAETERKLAAIVDDPWVEARLRPLVGLPGAAEGGGDRRGEAFTAWRRFFEGLADERPLVLVFEDLHWADDDLLDFVDHLVDWASNVPLLVVCSARPELLTRRPGWGGGKPNALTVSLAPLSDEETARLVAGLLDRAVLEADTQSALLTRAGGNPLYAEEYTRMLRERGVVEELPETVQGLIAARIDLLEPQQKALLQDAAVVGRTFWLGALGGAEAEDVLHALERREFVRRERRSSVAGDTEYAFRHILVRDVAYGQIPRADRAAKHLSAAEWLERLGRPEDHAETLAHHYLQALELGAVAGVDTAPFAGAARSAFSDAGDRATALHAYAAAERFYRAALDLPGEDRGRLLIRVGRAAYLGGGEPAPSLTAAHDELLAAGDSEGAAEADLVVSEHYWLQGERERARHHLARSRELVEGLPPSRVKAMVTATAARLAGLAGEEQEALELGREAIAMADELGLVDVQAGALINVGTVRHVASGDEQGLVQLEEGLRLARLANAPFDICRAIGNLSAQHWVRGELDRAFAGWNEAAEEAVRYGQGGFVQWFRGVAVANLYRAGRWDESLQAAEAFVSEIEAGSGHYLASGSYLARGLIRFARGEHEPARTDLAQAVELAVRAGDPQTVLPVGSYAALVALELGDLSAAEHHARPFLDAHAGERGLGFAISVANVAAWPLTALGHGAELASLLRRYPFPWAAAACAVAEGDPVRAAEICAGIGAREDEAYARLAAARAGETSQLAAALAFYRSVGATRYVRECEALTSRAAISGA